MSRACSFIPETGSLRGCRDSLSIYIHLYPQQSTAKRSLHSLSTGTRTGAEDRSVAEFLGDALEPFAMLQAIVSKVLTMKEVSGSRLWPAYLWVLGMSGMVGIFGEFIVGLPLLWKT
jgi:hypothetical protein